MSQATTWRELVDDAILVAHENAVPTRVTAAGFHPCYPAGIQLVEVIRSELRDGTLKHGDVDQELIWLYARERDLEMDLTPVIYERTEP